MTIKSEAKAIARDMAVVVVCAAGASTPAIRRLDDKAFETLHRPMTDDRSWRRIWWILSQAGWFGSVVLVSAVLAKSGRLRSATRVFISAAVAWVAAQAIKKATGIERPWDRLDGVNKTGGTPLGTAFPSGHPAVARAVAVAVSKDAAVPLPLRAALALLAFLVPAARIGVGAHYPLDVIAGFCLGDMSGRIVRAILG
ncbi:MAG: hypothetical protein C4318_06900 [Acidimicrobiia bacterium]